MASLPADAPLLTTRSGRVKTARRLARRVSRAEHRLFLAEGPQAVREALAVPGCVREVFAVPGAADDGLLARRTAWLFGNEAWGLRDADRALADDVVRVPIHGRAESLNLAMAATVCLYASARGRTGSARGPSGP
jgi:tRNA G18 (ribose-2'-O)-methylase SpoU